MVGYLSHDKFRALLDNCVELSPKTEKVLLKPSTSEGVNGAGFLMSQDEYLYWKKNNQGNERFVINSLPSYMYSAVENDDSLAIPKELMETFETDVQEDAVYKGQYIRCKKHICVIISEERSVGLTSIKLYVFNPKGKLLFSDFLGEMDDEHFFSAQFFPEKRNKSVSSFLICNAHVENYQTTFLFSSYNLTKDVGIKKHNENKYSIMYKEKYKPPFEFKYPTLIAEELVKDMATTQVSAP